MSDSLTVKDSMPHKLIFIFIDGIGLGEQTPHNPFCRPCLPFLTELLNTEIVSHVNICQSHLLLKGIDACLGVDGIPQSATGQTSLLTGQNAQKKIGFHYPAFPNKKLIDLIKQFSLLKQIKDKGLKTTFVNAYTPQFFEKVKERPYGLSVTTHCVLAAGLPFRYLDQLQTGNAVYWDITNRYLQKNYQDRIPIITPYLAGKRLATISSLYDLVLFESFLSDIIGHRNNLSLSMECLRMIDGFLKGVVENKDSATSILISSDHGNLEDATIGAHTRNPVPLLVLGPLAQAFESVQNISEITNVIVSDIF